MLDYFISVAKINNDNNIPVAINLNIVGVNRLLRFLLPDILPVLSLCISY